MKEITVLCKQSDQGRADPKMVAACGLYCGACKKYRMGKCSGCHKNKKASWCKIRK